MTENHQSSHFDDELLSAYVDGELTGDQLALVEQRLVADPRAAQLVEELRAMGQELQALPAEVVGEDLRATIIRRAERAMLLGADEQIIAVPRATASRRRWAWAACAAAAALLLFAYLPTTRQEERPLASAKPGPGFNANERILETPARTAGAADDVKPAGVRIASEPTSPPIGAGATAKRAVADREAPTVPEASDRQRYAAVESSMAVAENVSQGSDSSQLTCLVHITLSDEDTSGEQFAKLLVQNGIRFQEGEIRQALAPAREVEVESAADAEADADAEGVAAVETDGLAGRSRSPGEQALAADDARSEQLVLVEAQTERIENVLEDCNADTFHCAAVRVTQQQLSGTTLDRFRQWERSGKQLAKSKLRALKRGALAAKQTTQGWATRLDANQYRAGKLHVDRKQLDHQRAVAQTTPQPPIQVLFILQQATVDAH